MDQDKQKTSDFDLLMGDEMDDGSFEALWEEASKPLADKTGTSETDPLLASTIGRLLDWDDISNDKALWNELDARVAAKNLEKSQASEKGDASEPKSDVQEASLDSDLVLDSPEVSEEETAPKSPIEGEPLEETNVEPINDESKEEPVIEAEPEASEPEPVIEEESKEEEPLEAPAIESEPSFEDKEETPSEGPKEEPVETPAQMEEEKPIPVEHKPYKVAPKLNLGGRKDNKQDNKPKEKHTHAPVKHDFVDYNDAPGRFIIKCPQGYFVSDNKFSKDKGDAQVFYNFNKANRYKKLYGGKVVKL